MITLLRTTKGNLSLPVRWEIGNEFHWMGLPPAPFVRLPEAASWYLLGRHAVIDLLQSLSAIPRTLWVPTYFCHDVADYWRRFLHVAVYVDDPHWPEPKWSTLRPAPGDVVLAVNYFGVRGGEPWRLWREKNNCILLEDHSHDPVSGWAQQSRADYAFSSLRKTMPVPDGAILWSPRRLQLPEATDTDTSGSSLKLAAMIWKREYLRGATASAVKPLYRHWQQDGEIFFGQSVRISRASPYSQEYLSFGVPVRWRRQRAANVRHLLRQLRTWSGAQPLFCSWPPGGAPLAAVFCFSSPKERDSVRRALEGANIFCPIHWPAPTHCDFAVRELAAKILSIPADQRYRSTDMDEVARILLNRAAG